jgi:hypothetical protein
VIINGSDFYKVGELNWFSRWLVFVVFYNIVGIEEIKGHGIGLACF